MAYDLRDRDLGRRVLEINANSNRGDFVSFVKRMRQKASDLDVDLLLIDTGEYLGFF